MDFYFEMVRFDFMRLDFIRSDTGRMNSIEAAKICNAAGIPWVPIADEAYILPDDMEKTIMKDEENK